MVMNIRIFVESLIGIFTGVIVILNRDKLDCNFKLNVSTQKVHK